MTAAGDFRSIPVITCHGSVGNAGDEERRRNVKEKKTGEIQTTFFAARSDGDSRYSLESIAVMQKPKVDQ